MNLETLQRIFDCENLLVSGTKLPSTEWKSVTSHHEKVGPGGIFVAIKGQHFDGHTQIENALSHGASLVFSENKSNDPKVIQVHDTRLTLAFLAAAASGFPTKDMVLFGVTGTSGKTTTTFILEHLLKSAGHKVGLIGTIEIRIDGTVIPSTHTTPGPEELHPLLLKMKESGCTAVVMEVSSHALHQSRVAGVFFDHLGFTNLSAEHLDFHPTMEDYFEAKNLLFTREWDRAHTYGGKNPEAVLSVTEWGEKLFESLPERKRTNTHLLPLPLDIDYGSGTIRGTFSSIRIESSLIGPFNAENILVAVQMAKNAGVADRIISEAMKTLKSVPGRLERVDDPSGRVILVDYAHKPDALEKVLKTLKELVQAPSKLVTVIGCGGDRDRLKRPKMAAIAENYSDLVFLTSDNPRTENPEDILNEMQMGVTKPDKVFRDSDRRRAIEKAIAETKCGDWILIAGKGHETYQIIGKETFPFDDREVARGAIKIRL